MANDKSYRTIYRLTVRIDTPLLPKVIVGYTRNKSVCLRHIRQFQKQYPYAHYTIHLLPKKQHAKVIRTETIYNF